MKFIASLCLFIAIATSSSMVLGQDQPAVQAQMSQAGAEYITSVALPIVLNYVKNLQLPSQSGEKDGFDWSLTSITLDSLGYSNAVVSFNDDMSATVTGLNAALSANWAFKLDSWPHIPYGSGSAQVSTSSSTMSITATTGVTGIGIPTLQITSVNVDLGDFDITVSGSDWDWLIDLLKWAFANAIKSDAENMIQSTVLTLGNQLANQVLSDIPLEFALSDVGMELDLHLTTAPQVTSYIQVPMKGYFMDMTNPVPPPLPHVSFPSIAPTRMATVQLDQYLLNSALFVLHNTGQINLTITDKDIPVTSPIRLNTSVFQDAVPPLFKAFPNQLIEFRLNASTNPLVSIASSGASVAAEFYWDWLCQSPQTGLYQYAFTLDLSMNFEVDLSVNASNPAIHGAVKLNSLSLSLLKSAVGNFSTSLLQGFFSAIIGGPVTGIINQILSQGIPIPVFDGISFTSPELVLDQGYAYVATDLLYTPPAYLTEILDQTFLYYYKDFIVQQ